MVQTESENGDGQPPLRATKKDKKKENPKKRVDGMIARQSKA
jgi:hypothetical protein